MIFKAISDITKSIPKWQISKLVVFYTLMFKSHIPSDSSYQGVSVPGEVVRMSFTLNSTTSISGFM